ncbi:hypothetical protein AB9P05_12900 [Roseivirga sp. BDSF3-8]|uniref:hypothetical protein n=1 Tax=Roseivirga sp. BDSF3-8 TaxID=3241598 RepID=UPI003531D315
MRHLINRYTTSLLGLALLAMGCDSEDDLGSIPDWNENIGAVTLLTPNPDESFFNALNPLGNEEVNFVLDVDGFGVTEVNSVELILTFIESNGTVDEEGNPVDSVYAPILLREVGSFPSDVTVTGQEAAGALGISVDALEVGDRFQLTFPINTADGRRLTVPLSSDLCQQPAQPGFGGCSYAWGIACPSAIPTGTYAYVASGSSTDPNVSDANPSNVTGTVELSGGNGTYTLSDLSAGLYDYWYCDPYAACGAQPGNFIDVCNDLSINGQATVFTSCCGDALSGGGSYDPDTGVITLSWSNPFGDEAQITLTPQ